ncbi:MAG: cold shock domain-containing protein [Nanoarchaeota archaeon]|nr:cold shock domain-containing protein [Nanoarchaeota archaeon]
MKGTVKFFNRSKGYGFITGDDGEEYFVHISGLKEGVFINENDTVRFDTEKSDRGLKAVNVEKEQGKSSKEESSEEEYSEEESSEETQE